MNRKSSFLINCGLMFIVLFLGMDLYSQEINLLPKYGSVTKNKAQKEEDNKFIATIDSLYKGNRQKASSDLSMRGWQFLREGKFENAMQRFNQAWLIDVSNATALWGMAAVQANSNKIEDAVALFSEAEPQLEQDLNFKVDYAKALGLAAVKSGDVRILNDAFQRFEYVYKKNPRHVMNLQNWAITLFYIGKYEEAWKKIKLAEATSDSKDLDQKFIAALQSKWPRN